jgi:hypothetical protein
MGVDKTKRRVAHELIHGNGVHLRTVIHEFYRIGHYDTSGLTDKEVAYLNRETEKIREAADRISNFRKHIGKAL